MINRQDFIEQQILPGLGEHADCYDIDGVVDEVSDFDPVKGYFMKPEFGDEDGFDYDAYNTVLLRHEIK